MDQTRHLRTSPCAFGKQRSTFFTIFWHFMDQTARRLIEKMIDRLIDNENNRRRHTWQVGSVILEHWETNTHILRFTLTGISILSGLKINKTWGSKKENERKKWVVFIWSMVLRSLCCHECQGSSNIIKWFNLFSPQKIIHLMTPHGRNSAASVTVMLNKVCISWFYGSTIINNPLVCSCGFLYVTEQHTEHLM